MDERIDLSIEIPREEWLDDISQLLRSIDAGEHGHRHILNIIGIKGTGKSYLVAQIFDRLHQTYPVALLRFDTIGPSVPGGRITSLSDALDNVRRAPELSEIPKDVRIVDTLGRSAEQILIYSAIVLKSGSKQPFVLLLDEIDSLLYWRWIQDELIKPLIEQQRALVICTSRSRLFWHYWELEEQCDYRELEAFSARSARSFVQQYAEQRFDLSADQEADHGSLADVVTEPLYEKTDGHPGSLSLLMSIFDQPFDEAADTAAPMMAPEPFSPGPEQVVRYAGLLRRPANDLIIQLLDTFGDEQPQLIGDWLYEKPLHVPSSVRRGFESALRRDDPDRFFRICAWLAQHYFEMVNKKPITEWSFFNEWVYYATFAIEQSDDQQTRSAWLERLDHLLRKLKQFNVDVSVRVYKDPELVARLRQVNLLRPFIKRLMELRPAPADIEYTEPVLGEIEFSHFCRQVIAMLKDDLPPDAQHIIGPILTAMRSADEYFDPLSLREQMAIQGGGQHFSQALINKVVKHLQANGLVIFDPNTSKYRAHYIIGKVAPK